MKEKRTTLKTFQSVGVSCKGIYLLMRKKSLIIYSDKFLEMIKGYINVNCY